MKTTLTIAGSDCSGGAGIQADIKAISANGVFAMSVITAITSQNTMGVFDVENVTPDMIKSQINAIFDDINVDSIKIGMVSKIESIRAIGEALTSISKLPPIVLDPVMVSKSGYKLLSNDAKETLIKELFPLATLVTPNLPEAEEILNIKIENLDDMRKAAIKILKLGCKSVLIKGGHLEGDSTDLFFDGNKFSYYKQERINVKHTHGTGCTLSSAIAANIAKGMELEEAIEEGKEYITKAIQYGFKLGNGVGPTNHFYKFYGLEK